MTANPTPGPSPGEYAEWEETLRAIVASCGATMIIGGTDVGKTTFTRLLVNRAIAAGQRVAVLDADPGQSEIGPPSCVGLAFVDSSVGVLSELNPQALAFIGSVSPSGHLPEHITAVRRLADMAVGRMLVVDTSGYIHGSGARRLIQSECDLIAPAHIVALHRGNELDGILSPLRRRSSWTVHTPAVAAAIGVKSPTLRAQRRAMRFAAYFRGSQVAQYAFSDVAFTGTWLGGVPVAAHILSFLNQTLGPLARVYHAEMSGRHLGLMTDRPIPAHIPEMGVALGQLKAKELTVTVAPRLKHLVVGMEASNGKLLGLGLISRLDFRRGAIGITTPVRTPEAAAILHFGTQRIAPDGSDAGAMRPGEA